MPKKQGLEARRLIPFKREVLQTYSGVPALKKEDGRLPPIAGKDGARQWPRGWDHDREAEESSSSNR